MPCPHPFPSLPIPSLPIPSLPFPSLPIPSLPIPSHASFGEPRFKNSGDTPIVVVQFYQGWIKKIHPQKHFSDWSLGMESHPYSPIFAYSFTSDVKNVWTIYYLKKEGFEHVFVHCRQMMLFVLSVFNASNFCYADLLRTTLIRVW